MNLPSQQFPLVVITMGDPAGVGPEICLKALSTNEIELPPCRSFIVGNMEVLQKAAKLVACNRTLYSIDSPDAVAPDNPGIAVLHVENQPLHFAPCKEGASAGIASWNYIERAATLALESKIDAIVTAPINKLSIRAAGIPHIGHTEMLGHLAGISNQLTMFETGTLRVFFLSRHVSLRKACDLVSRESLFPCIEACVKAMHSIGLEGMLAVAGLNPHNGENGLFGTEESDAIIPAVSEAIFKGLQVTGPVPADSVFHFAHQGKFAAVLALYHDQGHIACKTLDFERTVSLTLGLPFFRSSVDHGTAFDIAWTGKASELGMLSALQAAARYALPYRLNIANNAH